MNAMRSEQVARKESERAAESAKQAADTAVAARKSQQRAEKQTARTNSLILASKAQNLAERYPIRSMLLASEAIQTGLHEGGPLNVEAENVLRRTLGTVGGTGLSVIGGKATCVAYSPDGKTIAVGYGSGVYGNSGVMLLDAATRKWLAEDPLAVKEGEVTVVAFSPDGQTIAAAYSGGVATTIWCYGTWAVASG